MLTSEFCSRVRVVKARQLEGLRRDVGDTGIYPDLEPPHGSPPFRVGHLPALESNQVLAGTVNGTVDLEGFSDPEVGPNLETPHGHSQSQCQFLN